MSLPPEESQDEKPLPALKSLLKSQEQMQKMFAPSPTMRSITEAAERFRQLSEPSQALKSLLKSQEQMQRMFAPSPAMRSVTEAAERLRQLTEPSPALKSFLKSQEQMQQAFESSTAMRSLLDVSERFQTLAALHPSSELHQSAPETLTPEEEGQVEQVLRDIAAISDVSFWVGILERAPDKIKFVTIFIILNIFLPIIVNIYSNNFAKYAPFTENFGSTQEKNTIRTDRETNSAVKKSLQPFESHGKRFVNRNQVQVRTGPTTKAEAIDQLPIGQIVRVVSKEKNWIEVEYEIEGASMRGWVFTRYTSTFK